MSLLTRETEVESLTIAWAEDNGWLCPKLQWIGQTGWPDRAFLKGGKTIFIEFKRPGGKIRAKQFFWIRKIREHGGKAHFCHSVEDAISVLKFYG